MLIIRFSRTGKKNQAYYRLVLAEKSCPVKGRIIENLGNYDPQLKKISFKKERVDYWIAKGASLSDTAYNLMVRQGVIKGKKRPVKIKKKQEEKNGKDEGKILNENKTQKAVEKKEEITEVKTAGIKTN